MNSKIKKPFESKRPTKETDARVARARLKAAFDLYLKTNGLYHADKQLRLVEDTAAN